MTESATSGSRRLGAEERRQAIVTAATEVFAGRAYDDVRMEEIAEAAGVSKALLYKHFPGKRELYLAVTRSIAGRLRDLIAAEMASRPGPEQGSAALAAFVRFAGDNRSLFLSLFHSGLLGDPEFGAEIEGVRRFLEDRTLRQMERTPQLLVGLRGVMGFVEAATVRWLHLPPGTMSAAEAAYLIETTLRLGLDRVGARPDPS